MVPAPTVEVRDLCPTMESSFSDVTSLSRNSKPSEDERQSDVAKSNFGGQRLVVPDNDLLPPPCHKKLENTSSHPSVSNKASTKVNSPSASNSSDQQVGNKFI